VHDDDQAHIAAMKGAEGLQERQQLSVLRCCGPRHAGKEDLREEHIARQKTHLNGDHTPNADTSEWAKTRKAKRRLKSGDDEEARVGQAAEERSRCRRQRSTSTSQGSKEIMGGLSSPKMRGNQCPDVRYNGRGARCERGERCASAFNLQLCGGGRQEQVFGTKTRLRVRASD
jgi:hypothetical protein